MTTRHRGYVVTLSEPVREDDAEAIMIALRMVSGVASVEPVEDDFEAMMARAQVRDAVRSKLYEAIDAVLK